MRIFTIKTRVGELVLEKLASGIYSVHIIRSARTYLEDLLVYVYIGGPLQRLGRIYIRSKIHERRKYLPYVTHLPHKFLKRDGCDSRLI